MPQPKKGPRFGGTPAHHEMILSNLATELIRHGRIRTTLAKAKNVQPVAERMITFAKRGDVHSRRQVLRTVRDKDVVNKLFHQVGPAFAERDGGYTRVLKLGPRKGDAAPMALIELVEGVSVHGEGELEEAPRRRWSLRRRRGGTQSVTARERSEERAAAADRGELDEGLPDDDGLPDEDGPVTGGPDGPGQPAPDELAGGRADTDEEGPQVSAADVEARFAAAEAEEASGPEAGPLPAEEQDSPAPERPGDESESTGASDEPEGGQDEDQP